MAVMTFKSGDRVLVRLSSNRSLERRVPGYITGVTADPEPLYLVTLDGSAPGMTVRASAADLFAIDREGLPIQKDAPLF